MSESGLTWDEALARCKAFLEAQEIDLVGGKCLLAVSGGMDSMCMMRLLADLKIPFGVAHVNYGLRGAESEADAEMVSTACDAMNVTFHLRTPDMRNRGNDQATSLQQYARRLRYEWFGDLCNMHQYEYVCTAHHQDDDAETFFINLLRGTGLRGLTGIPVVRGNIVRPMLCLTRHEIEHLVDHKKILYRHDTSNFEDEYIRNRIRHDILPWFESERPRFIPRMHDTQNRLSHEYKLLKDYLKQLEERVYRQDGGTVVLDRSELMKSVSPVTVLHYILQPFGFSWDQCMKIVAREYSSGARFLTMTHELVVDRSAWYVTKINSTRQEFEMTLEGDGQFIVPGGELSISRTHTKPVFSVDRNVEYIDGARLNGDLRLRRWRPGDTFHPIHGPGRQKLQDYFTNEKVPVPEKEQILLLTSQGEIVWVVGMRLDHRFRVTPNSELIIRLEWKPAH